MRNYLLIAIVALLSFTACKKESPETTIKGSWKLESSSGGMIPIDARKKHDVYMNFSDTEYKNYVDGELVSSGTYSIKKDVPKTINNMQADYQITLGDFSYPLTLSKKTMTIHFGEISLDGVLNSYKKQ